MGTWLMWRVFNYDYSIPAGFWDNQYSVDVFNYLTNMEIW